MDEETGNAWVDEGNPGAPSQPPPPPSAQLSIEPHSQSATGLLYQVGDIGVTHDMVMTPNGNAKLNGSTWVVSDQSRTEEKIPSWAIVMAIIFALACLIGLFFLLVKEKTTTGYVEVRVQSGELLHMTQIPVSSPEQVNQIRAQVGHIQSFAQRAQ